MSRSSNPCEWEVASCTVCDAPVFSYKHEVSFPHDEYSDTAILCDCCGDDPVYTHAYLYELVTEAAAAREATAAPVVAVVPARAA